jgi:hypothetical protein
MGKYYFCAEPICTALAKAEFQQPWQEEDGSRRNQIHRAGDD